MESLGGPSRSNAVTSECNPSGHESGRRSRRSRRASTIAARGRTRRSSAPTSVAARARTHRMRTRWIRSRWPSNSPLRNGTMCRRCQICGPIVGPDQADLFVQLAAQRVDVCSRPGSSPPPGSAHRVAVGNSKRTSSTRSSASTTSARTASRMRRPAAGSVVRGHSSGALLRPSLNIRYIS